MNVIDIGCFHHPSHQGQPQDSIGRLIERFRPEKLVGFDPLAEAERRYRLNGTQVTVVPAAVWDRMGTVGWSQSDAQLTCHIDETIADPTVDCLDIAWLVDRWGPGVVVKIDAEGAEYGLLARLHETERDRQVALLLVEWHDGARPDLVDCPVEVWE